MLGDPRPQGRGSQPRPALGEGLFVAEEVVEGEHAGDRVEPLGGAAADLTEERRRGEHGVGWGGFQAGANQMENNTTDCE